MQQNPAMMQQIQASFDERNVESYPSVQNQNDLHPKHPSTTDLSFTFILSRRQLSALFLKRAKNEKVADNNCQQLSTNLVPGVVHEIALLTNTPRASFAVRPSP